MKKTIIIATAAGLAMSSETQDNELFMNSIKNGYYTVSNAILSRPAMIAGGMQMIQNGMARPTFLNHFDEAADDEFMAKGHGQHGQHGEHGQKQKGDKKKNGKKPRPQPVQPEVQQPVEQVQDNNLAFEDDNLALEDYQDDELIMNSIKNGYYTVSNAILSRPAMIAGGMQMIQNGMARPTFLNHFDETADDEFMAKGHGQHGQHGEHGQKQKGDKKKNGKKPRPQPVQPEVQPVEQVQDNNLAFEDDNLALEDYQDDELLMNAIKNGYYTVSNAILSRPAMIAGGMQMIQNGMARPTFLNHFDETADDEFMAKGHGAHGEHGQKQKGDKKKNGKKPRPQPVQPEVQQPVEQVQDNNLAFEDDNLALEDYQDDELIMNSIKNGYYTVSNAILSRPAMIAGGMQMIQNGMARPTFLNHFDETADDEFMAKGHGQHGQHGEHGQKQKGDKKKNGKKPRPQPEVQQPVEQVQDNNLAFEDDNLALEDYQDDELIMNAIKNGYYTVSNAILSRPAMIAGGMQMIQNGMARPTFLNHFDENADDELAAAHGKTEKTEKTEKPRRKRQPLERPDDVIRRNTKLRIPKEVAADNTLFTLADLLEDN